MHIQERSYGGKLFRPRPEVYVSDDKNLVIIATPWGPEQVAKDFIDMVSTLMREGETDPDKTAVFLKSDSLDEQENRLRMSIMTVHEDLHDKYNEDTVTAGVEILCLIRNERRVTWFQLGAPFTTLIRHKTVLPIHHPIDLSFDFSTQKTLPPLPKELLGLQNYVHLESGSFRWQKEDRLLLISRSYIPQSLFQNNPQDMDLDQITALLAQDHQDHPFWIATLEIGS